jgi:hypothetical protein
MTNTLAPRQQRASLPVVSKGIVEELEKSTQIASAAFSAATSGNSITAAIELAQGIEELRNLFSMPEIQLRVQALQDTALGFRTDKDPNVINKKTNQPNKPYPYEVVKDAVIEALLRGLQLVGNQFNIIAGRFYCTKEGFESLIRSQPAVTHFKLRIGVPQAKNGGVIVECSATWNQGGESTDLEAEIPVKSNDSSTADQLIGKATRKFLSRCYQQMTGNTMPDGDAEAEVSTVTGVSLAASRPSAVIAPAVPAPVTTLTTEQQEQILTAIERQLTPIGQAAFLVDVAQCFGVSDLPQVPADQFSGIMQGLANAGSRERWDRGCASRDGELILAEQEIAALQPPAEPEAAPESELAQQAASPDTAPVSTRTIVRRPRQSDAEPNGENSDEGLQSQLI